MTYNNKDFKSYVNTAGKITVVTAFFGVVIFTFVFLLNIGANEFKQASAVGVATTSLTVLNTPPTFDFGPVEDPDSSTTTPTNSGDNITWTAIATDPSSEDYFLLVCDGNTASPTASNGAPPTCGGGDNLWAVSATTTSGAVSTAATTTLEAFAESNDWYAYVCDSVANARCTPTPSQGTATSSSPFYVNHRPAFIGYWNDSPADPGATVIFSATSTDSDSDSEQDTVQLHVCSTNSFNTVTDSCDAATIATSTFSHPNATANYTIPNIYQDDDYDAYGFIVDVHGHESAGVAQGTNSLITVNNVAPTISAGDIHLNGGVDMDIIEGIETDDDEFSLYFTVTDANSCDAVGGGVGDEFSTSTVSVLRSGIGSSSCAVLGDYDPNNCYTSLTPSTVWNIQCTASTTTCTDNNDSTMRVDCTFPLWFIADPTTGASIADTVYFAETWVAAIAATDDDFATSTFVQESGGTSAEVSAQTAISLVDTAVPYSALEPGNNSGTDNASTTAESTGNTGLDKSLEGQDMCRDYLTGNPCTPSATHTIPAAEQEFSSTTFAYGAGTSLSSTTPQTLVINIPKTTSTSTYSSGTTYWGIAVPGTITFAGNYIGENTFIAVMSDPANW